MASTMDSPTARAQAFWQDAKKQRTNIIKDIEDLKKGTSQLNEEDQLKKLESGIAEFRLRFAYTMQQDPKYASDQGAEDVMWKLHIFINMTYRNLINETLKGQQHVVTRRKVEKLYHNYLKTAQMFYKGYFQRLQSLHGMPQIPRMNNILHLEGPKVDGTLSARVSADTIQTSFYTTLLHLGDLSRWWHKSRPKPDGLKTALLYYELANDLKPTLGDAHHQMGIIFTEENNHLLVVYHLYRSLAVCVPHGNSKPNLENEFRRLLQSNTPSRRAGPPDPNEALSQWFVKLHARYYKGQQFSGQVELEEEVIHRLEIMLKKPGALALALKMALINIAAYYVAKSKIEEEWTLERSASCQFILRLNIRWILVLSRLVQSELQEFIKTAPPADDGTRKNGNNENATTTGDFSAFSENILPLMRIYMAWLYIYRTDVVDYQEHLGSYVFDMYRGLARSLTMVAKAFKGEQMTASPYLLSEDIVALGMKPFSDARLATVCRLQYCPDADAFKPHWEDCGRSKNTDEAEMRSRVYDVCNCGFSLALDKRFPLDAKPPPEGSDDAITISYIEGGKTSMPTQQNLRSQTDVEQLEGQFRDLRPAHEEPLVQQAESVDKGRVTKPPTKGLDGYEPMRALSETTIIHQDAQEPEYTTSNDTLETESDLSLEAQMVNMVDNLVDEDNAEDYPNRVRPAGASGSQPRVGSTVGSQESSYGMHTASAEQIFGSVPVSIHNPGAIYSWDSFGNPVHSALHQRSATSTPQRAFSAASHARSPSNAQGIPVISSLQANVPAFIPGARQQPATDLLPYVTGKKAAMTSQHGKSGPGTGDISSGLSSAVRGGFGHARQRLGGSTDSSGTSSFLSPKGNTGSYQISTGLQNADRFDPLGKSMSPPPGFGAGNSSFSTNFSQTASGLPPVHSPFRLPGAQLDGAAPYGEVQYHHQPFTGQLNNSALYHTNDFTLRSNGNIYNATTAFGRGDIATKDDPTHFRNAVKNTAMGAAVAEADAFDRAILESAFADDRPRNKR